MSRDNISRRNIIKLAASGGVLSLVPIHVGAEDGNLTLLGDFEDSLDGWKTNQGNDLVVVTEDEEPFAVTEGERALKVNATGDPYPMIENKQRVRDADFAENPYLLADVFVGEARGLSEVEFTLRFHYGEDGRGNGNRGGDRNRRWRGRGRQKKSVRVEETTLTLPQLSDATLFWDMSEIDDVKLSNPRRLEIAWRLKDSPSPTGPRGRGPREGYQGDVYFSNVRLTDDVNSLSREGVALQLNKLRAQNGTYRYEADFRTDEVEEGRFVFNNGNEIPVEFETVDGDRFVYSIDGESYRIGGGWR